MLEEKYLAAMKKMDEKLAFLVAKEKVNRKGIFKDGKTFSNQEKIAQEANTQFIETSSSLMVPTEFMEILKKKLKRYKGMKLYLHYLIRNYNIHIINGLIPQYSNVTTKYQDKDQSLKKLGIRPFSSDWAELQILRSALGLSMSAIFVYLLKADSIDFAKNVSEYLVKAGIPTIPNIDLFGEVHLTVEKSFWSRVLRYQESGYM